MIDNWPTDHRYKAVLIDPPWKFRSRTALQAANWHIRRDAEKHYPVMSLEEIAALPVSAVAHKDAHLWMWITGPMLVKGVHVPIMKAWGFRPSAMGMTWVKLRRKLDVHQLRVTSLFDNDLHVGLGMTTRKNAEFLILGRRGSPRRNAKDVREIILAPAREHSRKPDEQYERIESYCDGPYVELFARQRRVGWDSFGNEVYKFTEAAE